MNEIKKDKNHFSFYSILIYFRDTLSLINCTKNLESHFPNSEFGQLHFFKILDVLILSEKETEPVDISFNLIDQLFSLGISFKRPGVRELLPGCIACLEKLDTELTGMKISLSKSIK